MRNFRKDRQQESFGFRVSGLDLPVFKLQTPSSKLATSFFSSRLKIVLCFVSCVFLWFAASCSASYLKSMFPRDMKLESVNTLRVDGQRLAMDVPAVEESGFVFVPVRFAAQAAGARISWNEKEKKAVFLMRNKTVELSCCNDFFVMNGKKDALPVSVFLMEGRLMAPYKEVLSALSAPPETKGEIPVPSILEPKSAYAETPKPKDATLLKTKKSKHSEDAGWSRWGFGSFTRKIRHIFYEELFLNPGNSLLGKLFIVSYLLAVFLFFAGGNLPPRSLFFFFLFVMAPVVLFSAKSSFWAAMVPTGTALVGLFSREDTENKLITMSTTAPAFGLIFTLLGLGQIIGPAIAAHNVDAIGYGIGVKIESSVCGLAIWIFLSVVIARGVKDGHQPSQT